MTQDIWTSLEADRLASASYDPFRGMTLQEAAGMPTKHFAAEAYAPEPDWLTSLWQPMDYLWETGEQFVEQTSEKLPELLWGYGLSKLREVDEGAGVSVVHTQAPQAGGAPAQPTQILIPGQPSAYAPVVGAPKAAVISSTVLIGAAVIVLLIIFKK